MDSKAYIQDNLDRLERPSASEDCISCLLACLNTYLPIISFDEESFFKEVDEIDACQICTL